jgi:arylsulfatase A
LAFTTRMQKSNAKPNLIYILADDMGVGDLSCFNPESKIHTRHLDVLAAGGMKFIDAHASSAVCTPSRYNLLTGRYNWRSRLKNSVTWGYCPPVLEEGRTTVASFLRDQGYFTACVGKWHLGWNWAPAGPEPESVDFGQPITGGPTCHGFDSFFGIPASLDMPPYVYVKNDCVVEPPSDWTEGRKGKEFWREGPKSPGFDHTKVLSELGEEAIRTIEERASTDQPFFLYLSLTAPHTPILPLPEFQGRSHTNAYGDFCLQVDDLVGRIQQTLQRLDLDQNTILAFTSDNGCSPTADFEELAALNHRPSYHYRGHKADIYEGGHRVPLIVQWPERIKAGSTCEQTVCLGDLLATCADLLGVALKDTEGEDSVSNLPLWLGGSLPNRLREATVHHSLDGSFSIRAGRWKLEMCPGSGGWSSPRPGEECEGLPEIQLYDLGADIGERSNVYAEFPEVVTRLKGLLTRYIQEGRSTQGAPQPNTGGPWWKELWWLEKPDSFSEAPTQPVRAALPGDIPLKKGSS